MHYTVTNLIHVDTYIVSFTFQGARACQVKTYCFILAIRTITVAITNPVIWYTIRFRTFEMLWTLMKFAKLEMFGAAAVQRISILVFVIETNSNSWIAFGRTIIASQVSRLATLNIVIFTL